GSRQHISRRFRLWWRRMARAGRGRGSYVKWCGVARPRNGGRMSATGTLAQRFAAYATRLKFTDIPAAAIHEAKRRLIDSFATAVGAMDADAFMIARQCALPVQSTPGATVLGGGRSSVEWATFVNGLLIRYLDFNDTYLSKEPAHPSDNLAP